MAAEREPLALLRESSAENPTLLGYEEMGVLRNYKDAHLWLNI